MVSTVPPPTLFLDVSGRFARDVEHPIVVAGVAIETARIDELRHAILAVTGGRIIKWREVQRDIATARRLFQSIGKRQIPARATFILKHEPEWSAFWAMGDRLEIAVKAFPQSMPYATASMTLKYQIYGDGIADVLGFYLGRHKALLPPRAGVKQLRVVAVCDSDISGEQNQMMFREIFEKMQGSFPQTRDRLGIELRPEVSVKTEQEEPLLMLPDHIAGYIRSKQVYGTGPDNEYAEVILGIDRVVGRWPANLLNIGSQEFTDEFPQNVVAFEAAAALAKTDEGKAIIARNEEARTRNACG